MTPPEPPDVQQLFDAHAASLCRTLEMLTGSRFVAETVAEEVFRTFPGTWGAREASAVTPEQLLYRCAVVRVRRLWSLPDPLPGPPRPPSSRPGERLLRCITSLAPELREVLVLYDGDRAREPSDVAAILGIPQEEVLVRLRAAQERLRELWREGEP